MKSESDQSCSPHSDAQSAVRYSPWVVSEHVPDLSSFERMLTHSRFVGKRGEDLAIALWELMVDRELGLFHYIPALNTFWKKDEYDAIKTWNVYGFCICHCHASILASMGRAAGFKTRIAEIKGHEGTEFWYDDAWHYFDGDIQMYYRKHSPDHGEIASLEDLHADTTLITEQQHPSNPWHFPDRLPEQIVDLYKVPPNYLPRQEESLHSMDFMLRPGEKMQRYFQHKGRRFIFDNAIDSYERYTQVREGAGPAETGPEGPTERFWPHRQWGNGFYWYAPDLSNQSHDLKAGAMSMDGLQCNERGVSPIDQRGSFTIEFNSPYMYCGVADPLKRLPSQSGAELNLVCDWTEGASVLVEINNGTGGWICVSNINETHAHIDYTEYVEGHFTFLMRVTLNGSAVCLRSIENTLWFMVSPHSLPALRNRGANKMSVHHGDKFGFNSASFLVERNYFADDTVVDDCHAMHNAVYVADDYARLKPIDENQPWELIYALRAPRECQFVWLAVYAEFEGSKPGEQTDCPARIEVATDDAGPWTCIAEKDVVEHQLGWHFTLFAEAKLLEQREQAFVRFSCKKGLKGFRIHAHYRVAPAYTPNQDLLITHVWYEDCDGIGRRLKSHQQVIGGLSSEYTVSCDHQPHNHFVAMEIPSVKCSSALLT